MINLTTDRRRVATLFTLFALVYGIAAWDVTPVLAQLELSNPLVQQPTPAPELTEEYDVLTRGPLHEAFASPHQSNPESSPTVLAAPPELIDEVPPEYKPDGINVQWIPGYWAWDESQQDYIWISGVWRDVPPQRRWMPGYWDQTPAGYQWVAGFWAEESQQEVDYLPQPPASLDQGPSTVAPSEEHFYVPGNWQYQDDRYRWATGHWQPMAENWIWIPASYVWTPRGCIYQSGYWDYEFDQRGTCFAPVHFNRPAYLATNYQYQPSFAINLNIDFLTHLFVRPHYNHYFYGDWYSSNFTNLGFQPWVSYRSHYGNYDPLLAYYGHRRSTINNQYNTVQYLAQQHRFYVNNQSYRPRPTYAAQFKFHNGFQKQPNHRYRDYVKKSNYVRTFSNHRNSSLQKIYRGNDLRGRQRQRSNFHRIQQDELRSNQKKREQLARLQRERKRREIRLVSNESRRTTAGFRPPSQSSRPEFSSRQLSGGQRDTDLRNSRELARRNSVDQDRRARDRENANRVAEARQRADRQRRESDQRRQQQLAQQTRQRNTEIRESQRREADADRRDRQRRDDQQQRASELARQQRDRQPRDRQQRAAEQVREQSRNSRGERNPSAQRTRTQQDVARRNREAQREANRRSQQDAAKRDRDKARQESARRAQQAQRDAARRNQQDAVRRAQNKAKQDSARRAQQAQRDATRRAQQKSQQDAARRVRDKAKQDSARRAQQKSQRDAARRAQQKSQQDAARRAKQKAAERKSSSKKGKKK